MKISTMAIILLGTLMLCTTLVHADNTSLRCGNSLVSIGDSMYKVRRECGDPMHVQQVGERRSHKNYQNEQTSIKTFLYITEWVYEKNQGEYILTFEGSRLVHKEFSK